MKKFILLFLACLFSTYAHGLTCVAVASSAAGSGNGSDWTDAKAYSSLAGTGWARGDLYYLADGNYGTSLSITTAASGTTTIELRKAQSYDFGRSADGCSNDISAGWNAVTMGSSQAVWDNTPSGGSSFVNLGSGGYIIFNGNGQNAGTTEVGCGGVNAGPPATMTGPAPNPKACGILISDATCTSTGTQTCDGGNGVMHGGGNGIVFESTEWYGQGLNTNGNNNSETYMWFANGGALSNVVLSHNYMHNASTTFFTVVSGGWNAGSFDHNYVWGVHDGSANHGEAVQLQGSNGQTTTNLIHHNIFRDQQTNGDVVAVITGTETFAFYDNADICSAGGNSTTCRHNDGVIGCFNSQVCLNVLVYNNTFSEPSNCGFNVSGGNSTITYINNLFYNCGSIGLTNGASGTTTMDYNTYLCSGLSAQGAHDVSVSSSCPNPFTNVNLGAQLASDNSDWNSRNSLGSPYDTLDLYGTAFTTDRGAAQFISAGTFTHITITGKTSIQGKTVIP